MERRLAAAGVSRIAPLNMAIRMGIVGLMMGLQVPRHWPRVPRPGLP
ncbi:MULTISPECIES: hypothetical protein [unclassified Pseudomonas]|nr:MULTISPECIES: hypothetical protein [unclassified Pseudomonas]